MLKMTSKPLTALLALIAVSLVYTGANASKPSDANIVKPRSDVKIDSASNYVVIDQDEPAFIVFTGIPKGIDQEKLEKIRQHVSTRETATMLTWQQFLQRVDGYARSVVLRNDYPKVRVVDGIVCLIASKKGAGAPWGLTWNGGIALTFNDYQHARRTYEAYKKDPASYEPVRDPRRDPVNPRGHLPYFGCGG
ncbi:MAG: hypothetical protein P8X48_08695 [Acidiferrobacteraceae bacterium]|jgi:hypothetical protein